MSSRSAIGNGETFWDIPAVARNGAWAQKRELSAALRELISLCVTTAAPEDVLREAAAAVRAASARVAEHPHRSFQKEHGEARVAADLHEFADRSVLVGNCNPLAPPIRFHHEADVSVGEVTFGPPYEGAPGWVHGGIVAAAFDQLFGHLQVMLEVPSFTGILTINYRRPTPLNQPLRFEARLARRDGRKSFVVGKCFAGDVLTAESDAVFIAVPPERMREMVARGPTPPRDQER